MLKPHPFLFLFFFRGGGGGGGGLTRLSWERDRGRGEMTVGIYVLVFPVQFGLPYSRSFGESMTVSTLLSATDNVSFGTMMRAPLSSFRAFSGTSGVE